MSFMTVFMPILTVVAIFVILAAVLMIGILIKEYGNYIFIAIVLLMTLYLLFMYVKSELLY